MKYPLRSWAKKPIIDHLIMIKKNPPRNVKSNKRRSLFPKKASARPGPIKNGTPTINANFWEMFGRKKKNRKSYIANKKESLVEKE